MPTDLVVFGEDWGRHPSSTQHLISRLAERREVVWVNSIGMRRPRLNRRDFSRAISKLAGTRSGHVSARSPVAEASVPASVSLLSPLVLPWPGSRLAERLNGRLLARTVRGEARRRGLSRPILWTSLPTALPVLGQIDEQAVVYYCGDDFGALSGVDHAAVLEMEQRLVQRADIVIAASQALAARFPARKTLHVPHGVDLALFCEPVAPADDLPRDRPTLGYYGSLSSWVDFALIEAVACALSDWLVLLIGPVSADVSRLKRLGNVRLLGPRPHSKLPSYAQHWTVSMLPFVNCAQIRACNPLKLREYLAAGRPVVSTPFPAVEQYSDLVSIARGAEQFCRALTCALNEEPARATYRQRRVATESWDRRAADVERAIDGLVR